MAGATLSQLDILEAESIYTLREVLAESSKPGNSVLRGKGLSSSVAACSEGLVPR